MRAISVALVLVGALLLAGCGDDSEDAPDAAQEPTAGAESPAGEPDRPAADASASAKPEPKPGTTIKLGDSQFGEVLFDGDGQAIYYFDLEQTERSECYGDCEAAWPPVLTEGEPQAADGVAEGKLGTTKRDDGTTQVTYDGHPLYLYAHEGPDVVTCHNVSEFGGLWLAVQASGAPVG